MIPILNAGRTASVAVALALLTAQSGHAVVQTAPRHRERAAVVSSAPKVPAAPKRPVQDQYYDTAVTDDYRWLENWNDPAVRAWSDAENALARGHLDHLRDRPAILKRITELNLDVAPAYHNLQCRGGVYFAIKDQPPKQQSMLVRLKSLDRTDDERVLVDPNRIDPSGGTSIDFYAPSLDGSKVAVSLSKGGSESGTVYIYDTGTSAKLADVVPRVNGGTAGGSVAWNGDGTGFFHTRYPAPGERPASELGFWQQVWFHRLGTSPAADRPSLGRELPKIAEVTLATSDDGRAVLADVRNGDGGEHAFYLMRDEGPFERITAFADQAVSAGLANDALYLVSRQGAPNGKVLRLPMGDPVLARATIVVPPGGTAIEGVTVAGSRLYVQDMVGGPSQVRVFDRGGRSLGTLPLPAISGVSDIAHLTGDDIAVEIQSYTRPAYWARFGPGGRLATTALAMRSPADFSDVVVTREIAVSKDGTPVPVNILMKRGTRLDGRSPALLTGYGGFGISSRPSFNPVRRLWLDQGGIVAIANIRGGGEFGDKWHRAGNLTHKQNVFDDFTAAANHLLERHYTSKELLALQGGSNGGLLMGAMITQHPDLAKAVVSSVGIYDMLRVELSPNGLFNTTEYGTVKNRAQFEALYRYSPYHHVVDGTPYPAVLFTTGANDPRVDPMHSRKMTARLQAASSSQCPVLLRTSAHVGHGIGSPLSERNAQSADVYAFLLDQLGVRFRVPARTPAP